jgi:hippurate hydrolase
VEYGFIANGDGAHRSSYGSTEEGNGHGLSHDAGPCTLHNPHYDFNDALIPLGASFWVRSVETWLGHPR